MTSVSSNNDHNDSPSSSSSSNTPTINTFEIWKLPDVVLYHIACYVAAPTHRANFLCHRYAVLNQASHSLIESPTLWECVLHGDYHQNSTTTTTTDEVSTSNNNDNNSKSKLSSSPSSSSSPRKKRKISTTRSNSGAVQLPPVECRRSSLRLRRSPMERVFDAHQLMLDHTEIAYSYLWDLCYETNTKRVHHHQQQQQYPATIAAMATRSSSSRKKKRTTSGYLCRAKLVSLLNEYGPCLRYHRVMTTGGTFLVELCRAKNVTKATILSCVKELVERASRCGGGNGSAHAMIQSVTNESPQSQLTALCVAAVRALPQVVRYLLQRGADVHVPCSGRFRCQTKPKQTVVTGHYVTALQFAHLMYHAEREAGATEPELRDLQQCIRLLQAKENVNPTT